MMIGAGALAHMIQSLKYNNSLLKKSTGYRRLKQQLDKQTVGRRPFKEKDIDPVRLQKEKERIKRNFIAERRRNNIIMFSTGGVLTLLLLYSFIHLFFSPILIDKPLAQQERLEELQRANEKFRFYIRDGYQWLAKSNFHNALFQFEKAVEQDPYNYEANLGLAKALLKKCALTGLNCRAAKDYADKCERQFQKESVQQELQEFLSSAKLDGVQIK